MCSRSSERGGNLPHARARDWHRLLPFRTSPSKAGCRYHACPCYSRYPYGRGFARRLPNNRLKPNRGSWCWKAASSRRCWKRCWRGGAPGGDGRRVVGRAAHRGAARAGRADLRRRQSARDAGLRGGALRVVGVPRVFPLLLALALAISACQRSRPGPVRAMEPRPNPPVGAVTKPPEDPRKRPRQNQTHKPSPVRPSW